MAKVPDSAASPLRTRLSDAELIGTEFRVSDPEQLEGLNPNVPDPDAHPIIVGYYDETPAGGRAANPKFPFIRCFHCGLRRHWKGHVVRDDRDQLYIIGASKCGREHYGVQYESAEKAFKNQLARQKALRRWENMLKLAVPMTDEVHLLLHSDTLAALELKRDEIRRASPRAFPHLQQTAAPGQPIIEVRDERNFAAEKERQERYDRAFTAYQSKPSEERRRIRDEGMKPELESDPIYKRDYIQLGYLEGAAFLTDEGDVRGAALALRTTLDGIKSIQAQGTDKATSTELQRLLSQMTDRPDALRRALHAVSFTSLFFAPDNLARLEGWSRGKADYSFHGKGSNLVIYDSSRGQTEIAPLAKVELVTSPTVLYFEYYDEDFLPMMADAA